MSHQKSNESDTDDRSADESYIKLRGERDVIRLRNPTEDKRAFRRMLTSADLFHEFPPSMNTDKT